MNFPVKKTVGTENETRSLAREFAKILRAGDVVLFEGNLGSGKTFFIKAVLEEFGVNVAASPTFAIVNEYEAGNLKFYHFDFYRIEKEYELYDIGIEDYLSDENAITFIEWADLFPEVIFKADFKVKLKIQNNGSRTIEILKS
jgi:tRNA threonylcarbamoyladenosine biosynthesis protein TsaE